MELLSSSDWKDLAKIQIEVDLKEKWHHRLRGVVVVLRLKVLS